LENVSNKLFNYGAHKFQELVEEIGKVNLLNKQLILIERGIDECQHLFKTLIEPFVHAE
jgi:hypothetical protein